MNHPDYNSPADLKRILDENGFAMQKKFGQNFLINGDARKKLIDFLDIDEKSKVWEVGPGLGAMTNEILKRNSTLTAFEIDKGFASLNKQFFAKFINEKKFKIIEGDVLKKWIDETNNLPNRFFGNLPYNIAATLIADTIEKNIRFDKCVFTVQKEVALRMTAKPNTEDYSSFSVLCQWAYDITNIMDLTGGNFWPRPNVDSRAVLMVKKDDFPKCIDPSLFLKMQRSLFSSRRKTVKNNLSVFLNDNQKCLDVLAKANIDPMKRAEVLSIDELLHLSDIIYQNK